MRYFTIKLNLFLPNSDYMMKELEKIDKFLTILEKSEVGKIIESVKFKKTSCKGRIGYNPYNLFATIIYCFTFFKGSLRDIEDKCKFDLRVMYLMEGNTPDHSTIGNFINDYIIPYQFEIFASINKAIINTFNIDITTLYIDGTKIEADANKYKFVWKPRKYHQNLDIKIKDYLNSLGYTYSCTDEYVKSSDLYNMIQDYASKNNIDIYNIPSGRGCRRTKEQRYYKKGSEYLIKLLEYEEKERICGNNRNSYYKTDYDATAMVLKEDYYSKSSHDFHAGYNIQSAVSSGLVLMYGVFQDRNDFHTLIPMINNYYINYTNYPKEICADSGYGNYENYLFLKEHNIGNFIKTSQWSRETSGKKPILFKLNDNNDLVCLNDIVGELYLTQKHSRIKNGNFYKWDGCNTCYYMKICKKGLSKENKENNFRTKEVSIEYELLKKEARENLLSPRGIEIRINRSIQAEGTFGEIKGNMSYERVRRTSIKNVSGEIMLELLGGNIRRVFKSFDDNKFKNNYYNSSNPLQAETLPKCKPNKKTVKNN